MADHICVGTQQVSVTKVPGFTDLGIAHIDNTWRFVDLRTKNVIGPIMYSFSTACAYAGEFYLGIYG